MYKCRFCGKDCKNLKSLKNHERLCKFNPNRQISNLVQYNKTREYSWNKGLTAETDPRVVKYTNTRKQHYEEGKFHSWVKGNTKYTDERIAKLAKSVFETCLRKSQEWTWHKSLAKNMHYNYKGVDLDGTWELEYAKYLDSNNIKWIRPNDRFEYVFEDKIRHYTPDFYLVDQDVYVEIKGYKTQKDEAKWKQFPKDKKLKLLLRKDLLDLGIQIKL